jgi:hypothetical protein
MGAATLGAGAGFVSVPETVAVESGGETTVAAERGSFVGYLNTTAFDANVSKIRILPSIANLV